MFKYEFFLNVGAAFMPYRAGTRIELAYSGVIGETEATTPIDACRLLFNRFNMEHPKDYRDRSMSVGDVVKLAFGDTTMYFACDPTGWREIADPISSMNIPANFQFTLHRNVTFDPSGGYFSSDGYRPGCILQEDRSGQVQASNARAAAKIASAHDVMVNVGDVIQITDESEVSRWFAVEATDFDLIEDPYLAPRMMDVCPMATYFKYESLYEEMQKSGTKAFFIDAVAYAEAEAAGKFPLELNSVEIDMLYSLLVIASGNDGPTIQQTPVVAKIRSTLRKKLAALKPLG